MYYPSQYLNSTFLNACLDVSATGSLRSARAARAKVHLRTIKTTEGLAMVLMGLAISGGTY